MPTIIRFSYTTFKITNLKVENKGENNATVTVEVTNTGKVPGAEVVHVYLHDVESSVYRPKKELTGFEKVMINPGAFNILVGNSSRNIVLKETIQQ